MGFNPMQGRRPKRADLAVFVVALAAIAAAVFWALR
jgi:hypothetical protein